MIRRRVLLLPLLATTSVLSGCFEDKTQADGGAVDVSNVPLSTVALGEFPYLKMPKGAGYGYENMIDPKSILAADREYMAVNGRLMPIDGKSFKSAIEADYINGARHIDAARTTADIEAAITALGGVRMNAVPVPTSELERIGKTELYEKHYGFSIDPNLLDAVNTFVIRQADRTVWVQFSLLDQSSGNITILEQK